MINTVIQSLVPKKRNQKDQERLLMDEEVKLTSVRQTDKQDDKHKSAKLQSEISSSRESEDSYDQQRHSTIRKAKSALKPEDNWDDETDLIHKSPSAIKPIEMIKKTDIAKIPDVIVTK